MNNREAFDELLYDYWSLAYKEGKTGESQGDKANEVLHKLRTVIASQAQQEPVKQEINVFIDVSFMLPEMNTPVLGLVGKNLYALARVDYDEDAGWLWAVGGGDLSDIRNYEADDELSESIKLASKNGE